MNAQGVMVRMGELAVSSDSSDVLFAIGLGSCIGLVLVDARRGVAGLAHVVLPVAPAVTDATALAGKFAPTAVPALLEAVVMAGARRSGVRAVLAGGAQMFSFGRAGTGMDVGTRNDAAVRQALAKQGIGIVAAATLGERGRTMRVMLEGPRVTIKEAGGSETELLRRRP